MMDEDDYEAMKDMAYDDWPGYKCGPCRRGACEDCLSLGFECPCCRKRASND